ERAEQPRQRQVNEPRHAAAGDAGGERQRDRERRGEALGQAFEGCTERREHRRFVVTASPAQIHDHRCTAGVREAHVKMPRWRSYWWSMIFFRKVDPPRIKSGAGFFGIML